MAPIGNKTPRNCATPIRRSSTWISSQLTKLRLHIVPDRRSTWPTSRQLVALQRHRWPAPGPRTPRRTARVPNA